MTNVLPDGTVIPSCFAASNTKNDPKWNPPSLGQFGLKVGTVFKVYYPDDPESIRKNRMEYDVTVGEQNGQKGQGSAIYPHCVCGDMFGGIADTLEYSLRPSDDPGLPNVLYQTGSRVLVLCLNGDTNSGIIIGGVRNIRRSKAVSKDRGHFLDFEFNGVNVEINNDGEMTLTYKSKTDLKGTPQDETSGGTFIKIDKTGSVEIHANDNTLVRVDKPTDTITVSANEVIREDANGQYIANAPEMKIGGDGADEPLILGNLFKVLYNSLVNKFNNHTHKEHDWAPAPPNSGYITTGPTAKADKMTEAQLSDFVTTKKTYEK